jgi:phospholipid/cholesterol/gamma-HCH transport system substrate-binding protein
MYKKFDLFFGFFVIGVFLWFLFILLSYTFSFSAKSYKLKAMFSSADGISKGADVKIAGVKIGEVLNVDVNKKTFSAEVELKINADFKLPIDTSASIQSSGILGGKYIELSPGFEEENLKDGGLITITQSSVNLEKLISIFASGGVKK